MGETEGWGLYKQVSSFGWYFYEGNKSFLCATKGPISLSGESIIWVKFAKSQKLLNKSDAGVSQSQFKSPIKANSVYFIDDKQSDNEDKVSFGAEGGL